MEGDLRNYYQVQDFEAHFKWRLGKGHAFGRFQGHLFVRGRGSVSEGSDLTP